MSKSTLAVAPATVPQVTIWLRQTGSRRQAFYRFSANQAWRSMPVPLADKALRQGQIPSGPMAGAIVVSHETQADPLAARLADFSAQAIALNRSIDSISAGGAA